MGLLDDYRFKIADRDHETEAIHSLNYKTFVEEIPQHSPNQQRQLIDKFHTENTYIICSNGHDLAGMIAFRDQRPFSLDSKLENLGSYLPEGRALCEIRLLAVEPRFRHTRIAQKLIATLMQYAIDQGSDLAVISGTVRQAKLYSYLGFESFGPLTGSGDALYQPMYMTAENYTHLQTHSRSFACPPQRLAKTHNFLPGPVALAPEVTENFNDTPCSHRSSEFATDFQNLRQQLCQLTNANHVSLLMGPASLANDAIAGQLAQLGQPGLIIESGEFGRRLIRHARGAGLDFDVVSIPEGQAFNANGLALKERHQWIWGTHCETSTGVLHDLEMLKRVSAERKIKLCMDCISSIGTTPLDLNGVYLASGTSGKGLASVAGIAIIFSDHTCPPAPDKLPAVLDLGSHEEHDGIPFTIQSNLVYALLAALRTQNWPKRYNDISEWSVRIRKKLTAAGIPILAAKKDAMPAVITIPVPKGQSRAIGDALKNRGILASYLSDYLLERSWIQICALGANANAPTHWVRALREIIFPTGCATCGAAAQRHPKGADRQP